MTDPEKLIAAYLDDALTEAEGRALNAWLTADRANLRRFTDALVFEEQIGSAASAHAAQRVAADFAREPEVRAMSDSRGGWFQRLRPAWAFAAAAALVIVGASLWRTQPEMPEPELGTMEVARTNEWTVPTDALLTEAPMVTRLSEEISELLEP
jgi:anti-sigma factor RsiW